MLQKVEIIGNIVADAELKSTKDGREFVSFRVAVDDGMGDSKRVTYYDVSYVKNGAFDYLKKGQCVYVTGGLSLAVVQKEDKAFLNAYVFARDRDVVLCGFSKDN